MSSRSAVHCDGVWHRARRDSARKRTARHIHGVARVDEPGGVPSSTNRAAPGRSSAVGFSLRTTTETVAMGLTQLSERLRSQIAGTMLSSNGASVEVPPPSVSDRPDDAKDDGVAADDDDDDDDNDDEWPVPLLAITISVGLALATGVALAWTRRRAR